MFSLKLFKKIVKLHKTAYSPITGNSILQLVYKTYNKVSTKYLQSLLKNLGYTTNWENCLTDSFKFPKAVKLVKVKSKNANKILS